MGSIACIQTHQSPLSYSAWLQNYTFCSDRLRNSLRQLEKERVLAKVNSPTPWVSSLIITETKYGKIRICLDPRCLNKTILIQHYSIPTPADVLTSW